MKEARACVLECRNGYQTEITFECWTLFDSPLGKPEAAKVRAEVVAKQLGLTLIWQNINDD